MCFFSGIKSNFEQFDNIQDISIVNSAASKAVETIGSFEWEYFIPIEDIKIKIEEQSKIIVEKNDTLKSLKDKLAF